MSLLKEDKVERSNNYKFSTLFNNFSKMLAVESVEVFSPKHKTLKPPNTTNENCVAQKFVSDFGHEKSIARSSYNTISNSNLTLLYQLQVTQHEPFKNFNKCYISRTSPI